MSGASAAAQARQMIGEGSDTAWLDLVGDDVAQAVGDDLVGDVDPGLIINAATEILKTGVSTYEQQQGKAKMAQAQADADRRGIAADEALARAYADLASAGRTGDALEVEAIRSVVMVQEQAAAQLPRTPARAERCKARVAEAAAALQKAPKDQGARDALAAWQRVCAGVPQPGQPGGAASSVPSQDPTFFLKRKWGVPVWGWFLIVPAAAATVAGLVHWLRAPKRA